MIDWDSCVLWLDSRYFSESKWWDRSKYANDGVVNGAVWKGDAFYFSGNNTYVNCGNIPELDNASKITFEAVVIPYPTGTTWNRIVTYSKDTINRGGIMKIGASNKLGVYLQIGGTVKHKYGYINEYELCHIVGIWTETKIKLWLNKKYIGSNNSPGDWAMVSGEGNCKIGTWLNATNNFWYGFIKLVRIYKKELSEDEIKTLATMEGF